MARTPANYDITVRKGDTYSQVYQFKDSDGDPIDLTSWSAKAQIREKQHQGSNLIIDFTATITDAVNGKVKLSLTSTQTAAISNRTGHWDLLLTNASDEDETYLYGEVTFTDTVTVKS